MHQFYNRAILVFAALLTVSLLVTYGCIRQSYIHVALLPAEHSRYPSHVQATSDSNVGGESFIRVITTDPALRFQFKIAPKFSYPFAAVELWFVDRNDRSTLVDLSSYTTISFSARCSPAHTLAMAIPTFDPKVSVRTDVLSYRTLWTFFACNESGGMVELDLTRLETPQWWYDRFKFDLLRHNYTLDQVPKIGFGTSPENQPGTLTMAELGNITLNGRDYRPLVFLSIGLLVTWGSFGVWFFRAYAGAIKANVNSHLHNDMPLIEYQQLTIEPHRDREKADIMHYIAVNFANADLDIETVATHTATSRTKINEVLKSSFGYTFSGYLNKLRLTEAARLLSQNTTATISEIAYNVGYANVPYFNKLFKEQYGCTPKAFRNGAEPSSKT
jgi:AraC-like DNA-binding protein